MRSLRLALLALLSIAVAACDSGPGGSLYDPDAADGPAPVITAVSPEGPLLAGIDEVTLTGQHFSPTASENLVFFDDGAGAVAEGTVLSASATALTVRVPNLANEALRVRVSVVGASAFSNAVAVPLVPAAVPFGDLDGGLLEDPRALASTGDGGVYVTFYVNTSADGVRRFAPDGSRSAFSTAGALWTGLAPLPNGSLAGVRQNRGVYEIPEGGASAPVFVTRIASGTVLRDVAAAGDGTLWTAGTHPTADRRALYRFAADGDLTATVPFEEPVVSLAVAGGALYVATQTVDADVVVDSKVWRFPIEAGGLGTGAVVYDVVADRGTGIGANAVAVAADGTVFVATNAPDPLVAVAPDGTPTVLYPGVVPSPLVDLAWGPGTKLYAIQGLTADELADDTGRVARDLFRIDVRRAGPVPSLSRAR